MQISNNGKSLIKSFEGCQLEAYICPGGTWTIGWGHTGSAAYPGNNITKAEADKLFDDDIVRYEIPVQTYNELNQNQYDSLVSFCYNCGPGALEDVMTSGDITGTMSLYNKGGGEVLPGLVRRRKAEIELYNTPIKGSDKVDNIVIYSNSIDKRAAEYLADYLKCPTISSETQFDFSVVKNIYAVGGNKGTYTSYLKEENFISGIDRYETVKSVLRKIGKL